MIKQRIQQLIAVGGNCVNLGRTMAARHPDLHSHIMGMTGFLDHKNPKFNERVWCVMNDITGPVIDATGKPARFDSIFTGYVMCERVAENARKNAKKQQQLNHTRSQARQARDQHIEHCLTLAQRVGSDLLEVGRHIDKHVRYWKTGGGKSLYGDDAVAGVDYVICPVTGLRKAMINAHYVGKILKLTMTAYAAIVGPDFVYVAPGHKAKIAESLKEIDTDTGLTRHQKSQLGRTETMNVVNPETGLTPNQMIGVRTRETHMSNIDELGRNGYERIAAGATIVGNRTKQARGLVTLDKDKIPYRHYKTLVQLLTKKCHKFLDTSRLGRAGTPGATQVDHKYSVMRGFKHSVSPLLIGNLNNLEVLEWRDNTSKQAHCSITLDELCNSCGYTVEESAAEFDLFMSVIDAHMGPEMSAGVLLEKFYNATRVQNE